ncbi:MAG: radical SAM protein [Candidatus Bathyarchaeota archaeon]|nr:radical SAM protein [Candidatus Bathyarchaeota archaeon]
MKYVYLILHLFWLELKRILFGVKYFAEVDVTDNCNLRCKHCYHFNGKNQFKTHEVPIVVWKSRFNEQYKKGIRSILLVGGEPALRMDVLMLADKVFPYVYVITNGTIKIPKEFDHTLYVSLDGPETTNDSLRGEGVFAKVLQNYSGDKRVVVNMTATNDNFKELEDIVKVSKENGFKGVVCNICAVGATANSSMTVKRNERTQIISELKRIKKLYPKDFLLSQAMIKWYEYPDHRDSCYWGDQVMHFDVSWSRRRCFSKTPDCSNCGCFAGSFQSPFRMLRHPKEMVKIVA